MKNLLQNLILLILTTGALVLSANGYAQSQNSSKDIQGGCVRDMMGDVICAPPNGGIAIDRMMNQIVCGIGQCAKDSNGLIYCSTQSGGGAAQDNMGVVRCLGGCEPATASICEKAE